MCFGTIRSTIVDGIPGGLANLMRRIMHVFFPAEGPSLSRGITLVLGPTRFVIRSIFAGFLCDEKAHKQITDCKGASGRFALCAPQKNKNKNIHTMAGQLAPQLL